MLRCVRSATRCDALEPSFLEECGPPVRRLRVVCSAASNLVDEQLIAMKRLAGRPQDVADIEKLEGPDED